MTSLIITSTDKKKREEYIAKFSEKQKIDKFDITLIQKEEDSKNTKSIGIEDIKNLQKKIFLKPINSENKLVIIEDAHLLTTEAQNSLLKVLEEPPDHTIIALCTDTKEALLPTIISRCKIIELEKSNLDISEKDLKEFHDFIQELNTFSIGYKLKKAEVFAKDKDEAVVWIEKLIIIMRDKMLEEENITTAKNIRAFQDLHKLLKTTNVNPRFAIENTLLNL